MKLLLSALVILGTWCDCATTIHGYYKYHLREASPFWTAVVSDPSYFYLLQTAFWLLIVGIWFASKATVLWFALLGIVRFVPVVWNLVQIVRARAKT